MASTARGNCPLTKFVWQHLQLWLIHWRGREAVGLPLFVQQGRCNPSHNGLSRKHNYSSNIGGALPTPWSIGGCLGQPSPPNAGKPERGEGAMPHFIKLLFKYSEIPPTLDTSFVSLLHHEGHHVACHSITCHCGTACGNGQ